MITAAALFEIADKEWHAELVRVFGANANHFRYTNVGHGEPNSDLRRAWDKRKLAARAWFESK